MQLDMFPTIVRLQCIHPTRNKRRFYVMQVPPTLFDDWELVREWGSVGCTGQMRCDAYPSAGPALDALLPLMQQKGRRGISR
jgi:predicted DNA-binding WGR domain protein